MTTAEPIEEREALTYELFGTAIRDLAHQVDDSGWEPDWILSIARGGLLIGGALAYALGMKNVATMNVEFYTDVEQRRDVPVVLPPVLELVHLADTKVLVADDVADTGETLQLVRDMVADTVAEVRTLVVYEKSRSVIRPDYVWRRTDRWIDFAWSAQPPVTRRPGVF
ncbi:phosphoribosyltransferase [Dermatobacter hominis]|uniref:phosphoribosyltransferase n=1 Tax=Dermatobacter hominis TaxID=2884263 RepID=UPI001D11B2C3|nr:phosphoribosyltransferase family protein [Dermatobacter hominis]UDY36940.1 phosphoribosyltransferase [Dermatobacter hominis]